MNEKYRSILRDDFTWAMRGTEDYYVRTALATWLALLTIASFDIHALAKEIEEPACIIWEVMERWIRQGFIAPSGALYMGDFKDDESKKDEEVLQLFLTAMVGTGIVDCICTTKGRLYKLSSCKVRKPRNIIPVWETYPDVSTLATDLAISETELRCQVTDIRPVEKVLWQCPTCKTKVYKTSQSLKELKQKCPYCP